MGDTETLWKQYRREYQRKNRQRDHADRAGKMFASQFARLHGMNPRVLRRRMRKAKYKREGNRNLLPVRDLEKFL
jgi:hypothetical protein